MHSIPPPRNRNEINQEIKAQDFAEHLDISPQTRNAIHLRFIEPKPSRYIHLGEMNSKLVFFGELHFKTERKKISSERNPSFKRYCQQWKLSFEPFQEPRQIIISLFLRKMHTAYSFMNMISSYNSFLSFASFKCKWVSRGAGTSSLNPTMMANGRMFHYIGALIPPNARYPLFLSC